VVYPLKPLDRVPLKKKENHLGSALLCDEYCLLVIIKLFWNEVTPKRKTKMHEACVEDYLMKGATIETKQDKVLK